MTFQERFNAKWIPEPTSGCWLWVGAAMTRGYGNMLARNGRHILAHRASWELHRGPIPDGQFVLHRCDNPACVNPDHLFLGDQTANMSDCANKSRTAAGEKHGRARLSADDVATIHRLRQRGLTYAAIAKACGVSHSHVAAIVTGQKRSRA